MSDIKPHILVADDAPLIRGLLKQVLSKYGYTVDSVENGRQAIEYFVTHHPDLILMDADMPVLDGVTACRAIRRLPDARHLPILIVTAFVEGEWVDNAYAAGATDYITKPINWDVLRNRIHYILQAKRAEEALFGEKEKAQVTLASIGDGVITTDAKGCVEYLNPVASKLTGWEIAQAQGQPLNQVFSVVSETTQAPITFPLHLCLEEGKIIEVSNNLVLIHREGQKRFAIEDSAAPIRDRNGQIIGIVLVFHDVTENRKLTQKLTYQAQHDPMTGLFNVHAFNAQLDQLLQSTQPAEEHALLYMDLDQFKVVNDTCGHEAGDQLLKRVAFLLQNCINTHHTFKRAVLARLGGDEFALLLEHCLLTHALSIAENLCQRIHGLKFVWINNKQEKDIFSIGVSIGLVPITAQLYNPQGILAMADAACYAAKNTGRNNVHIYQEDDAHPNIQWVSLLKQGFKENKGLILFQQPIIPLNTTRHDHCYEVFLRVDSQQGYLARPGAFLSAAERYNLMSSLDRWVVRTFIHWLSEQIDYLTQLHMGAVNISGHSFNDEDFVGDLVQLITQSAIPTDKLCFEISERVLINNFTGTRYFMEALSEIGCRFALDDFGSGMASFAYLEDLPIHFLKIDAVLVKNCALHAVSEVTIKTIHQVAHLLGLETIAENIENEEVFNKVKEIGIDYGQGYYLKTPQHLIQI